MHVDSSSDQLTVSSESLVTDNRLKLGREDMTFHSSCWQNLYKAQTAAGSEKQQIHLLRSKLVCLMS